MVEEGLAQGELDLRVEVPHVENSDVSDEGEEVDLPLVARNLSPRMVAMRELDLASTLLELNIDSLDGKDKKGRKGKGLRAQFQSDR